MTLRVSGRVVPVVVPATNTKTIRPNRDFVTHDSFLAMANKGAQTPSRLEVIQEGAQLGASMGFATGCAATLFGIPLVHVLASKKEPAGKISTRLKLATLVAIPSLVFGAVGAGIGAGIGAIAGCVDVSRRERQQYKLIDAPARG